MNKADVIEELRQRTAAPSRAAAARSVQAFIDIIVGTVAAGQEVRVGGLGVFERAYHQARAPEPERQRSGRGARQVGHPVPAVRQGQGRRQQVTTPARRRSAAGARTADVSICEGRHMERWQLRTNWTVSRPNYNLQRSSGRRFGTTPGVGGPVSRDTPPTVGCMPFALAAPCVR
ncbi:HU family DNA-binding protein [Nonomuraea sp. NEAU-A123]|nr:HU family DNA-binding protein [Nonomuraea sp. NEAU-A123]